MSFWPEGLRNWNERIMTMIDLEKVYSEFRVMISGIQRDGIKVAHLSFEMTTPGKTKSVEI